jgi:hypothetical protein
VSSTTPTISKSPEDCAPGKPKRRPIGFSPGLKNRLTKDSLTTDQPLTDSELIRWNRGVPARFAVGSQSTDKGSAVETYPNVTDSSVAENDSSSPEA